MQQDFSIALENALKTLKASDRFESEVRARLHRFSPDVIDAVVLHLRTKGILNDVRTASAVVSRRTGSRAVGRERLITELERKGADAAVIEGALPDSGEERERLRTLLQSKFSPLDDRAKAGRFLYSRGFSTEDIDSELDAFFGGHE
ncbi:MAG TPA: RecX family transcriptional regulator [Fimbriimonas sp.]|nr:RecX family transcriptional regulator [Fimbriimonas sp.]